MHMLLAKPLRLVIPLARDHAPMLIPPQLVNPLAIHPMRPGSRVAGEPVGSQDAVARGVLDVDVQVGAAHADDHVEVDGQDVGDALFDGEGVLLGAAPPAGELGPEEEEGDERHGDGPFAARGGVGYVLGFGFGWEGGC